MSVRDQRGPPQSEGPNLGKIEDMRNHSAVFRGECTRLILETDKACRRMQDDDSKRLGQRVRDIQFLKKELEVKLDEINVEIDILIALQSRVVKALESCKEPLRVTLLCLEERMKRPPSERLRDGVDRELLKEREVIDGVASLLQRLLEQITEQIRLNRSAKYQLEQDLKEKYEAQCIDNSFQTSLEDLKSGSVLFSYVSPLTPTQWETISDINIAKAEQQKTNSLSLRAFVESLLEQMTADVQKQAQATIAAFQLNVQEIKSAKSQMEDQLGKILSEIASQQRISEDLKVAITEKGRFLSLAQARLDLRERRPVKEQCHDPAQTQLLTEVQQLTAHINKLREAVAQSEEEQRAMVRCQIDLEEIIQVKVTCLYIDEVTCPQHKEPIFIHNF
uniref:Tektin n=1 Tax=Scophthalmus maximus TaxID=52904 RepID=A0A8D3B7U2_SCOMX